MYVKGKKERCNGGTNEGRMKGKKREREEEKEAMNT